MISFPLENKHVLNEQYVIQKSHDAKQKNPLHMVHFKIPRGWFETNSWHQKRGKKICGCHGLLGRVVREKFKLQLTFNPG